MTNILHPYLEQMLNAPWFVYLKNHHLLQPIEYRYQTESCSFEFQAVYADVHNVVVFFTVTSDNSIKFLTRGTIQTHEGVNCSSHKSSQYKYANDNVRGVMVLFSIEEGTLLPGFTEFRINVSLDIIEERQILRSGCSVFFNPSVMVIGKRDAILNQTEIKNGLSLTLNRVAITPSETRFWLPPIYIDNSKEYWFPLYKGVNIDNHKNKQDLFTSVIKRNDTVFISYRGSLYEEYEIGLIINQLVNQSTGNIVSGPWVFHFTVPPTPTQP